MEQYVINFLSKQLQENMASETSNAILMDIDGKVHWIGSVTLKRKPMLVSYFTSENRFLYIKEYDDNGKILNTINYGKAPNSNKELELTLLDYFKNQYFSPIEVYKVYVDMIPGSKIRPGYNENKKILRKKR